MKSLKELSDELEEALRDCIEIVEETICVIRNLRSTTKPEDSNAN